MTHSGPVPAPGLRQERRADGGVRPPVRVSGSIRPAESWGAVGSRPGFVLFLALLGAICLGGAPYYAMSAAARVRSPLHPWLKSSGYIGQSAGILALAIFLFLWLYPLRKKFPSLSFTGGIARWLDVHVLAALALPLLVAIHAAWRFDGLIGLGFWSMMVVWFSGIAGRYIYARIPRSRLGVELSIDEISTRRKELLAEIARSSGLDANLVATTLAAGQGAPAPGGGVAGKLWGGGAARPPRRPGARAFGGVLGSGGPRRPPNDP